MSDALQGGPECLRCGSLLPTEDEGICPTCGTDFGRATIAMPALKKPLAPPIATSPMEAALGAPQARPEGVAMPPGPIVAPPPRSNTTLYVALGVIVVLILGALAAILILIFAKSDSSPPPTPSTLAPLSAPAPEEPPAEEAPAEEPPAEEAPAGE